jgi:hypothetical protein
MKNAIKMPDFLQPPVPVEKTTKPCVQGQFILTWETWPLDQVADFANLLRHSNNGYDGRIVASGYDG